MQLYFIQAKVSIRVRGIAGPFEEVITKLVQANSAQQAQQKYENHIRQRFSHMEGESFDFNYFVIADTI